MAKVKLTEQDKTAILHHLMVNHLPGHIIQDFKDVQFPNGKHSLVFIVVRSRIMGEGILHTNLFLVNRNYWNKEIIGLIKK